MNTTPIDHKIEFMAWDKTRSEMFCYENQSGIKQLNFTQDMTVESVELFDFLPDFSFVFKTLEMQDIELMQRTALRSINDEPIYNHMIVKDEYGVLRWVDMHDYNQMYFLNGRALEIIGNRFQHPELLELCK